MDAHSSISFVQADMALNPRVCTGANMFIDSCKIKSVFNTTVFPNFVEINMKFVCFSFRYCADSLL